MFPAVYTGMDRENKTWRDCTVRFESDNLWIQDKKKVDRRKLKVEDKPYIRHCQQINSAKYMAFLYRNFEILKK